MRVPRGRYAAGWSVTLTLAQAAVVAQALADVEATAASAPGRCADCNATPVGTCVTHLDDLHQANAYRELAAELAQLLSARVA